MCRHAIVAVAVGISLGCQVQHPVDQIGRPANPKIQDEVCDATLGPSVRCGVFEVPEDRTRSGGRLVSLRYIILSATGATPQRDPIFLIAGGPGQSATEQARFLLQSPFRNDRDIVMLDQRGTSRTPRLDCGVPTADADIQIYLSPIFEVGSLAACRDSLTRIADLTKYTTPEAVDDLDEFRTALGYDRINLLGASYGTRVILQYLRQKPSHVRSAVMTSATPLAFRNPLFHARSAQDALDSILAECATNNRCREAFPTSQADLDSVLARLSRKPATVGIPAPSGKPSVVQLPRDAFAEALRVMMYFPSTASAIPRLLRRAAEGDYAPFATQAVTSNKNLRSQLRMGLLMSVLCNEDVPRIQEREIQQYTTGTFLGDSRVRQQIAACNVWPKANLPADYASEVTSSVPALVISGRLDPVTPPVWGSRAVRGLSNGRHIVVEGGHSPVTPCLTTIIGAFFKSADARAADVSCSLNAGRIQFQLNAGPPGP